MQSERAQLPRNNTLVPTNTVYRAKAHYQAKFLVMFLLDSKNECRKTELGAIFMTKHAIVSPFCRLKKSFFRVSKQSVLAKI